MQMIVPDEMREALWRKVWDAMRHADGVSGTSLGMDDQSQVAVDTVLAHLEQYDIARDGEPVYRVRMTRDEEKP